MWKFLRHLFFPHESNNQRAKFLHPSSLVAIIVLFLGLQLTINQLTNNYPQILGYASQISPEEIIGLTNIQRTSAGLPEVKLDPQLSAAAAQKAADMFARDYWAHISPVGTQPWYFITESGYSYRYAGENLARDFSDAKSIVDAWVASPTHRDNLLNSNYQNIGIAVIDGTLKAGRPLSWSSFWYQALRRSRDCPGRADRPVGFRRHFSSYSGGSKSFSIRFDKSCLSHPAYRLCHRTGY